MVYVILLNWNGWKDTLHCLESLFRSEYEDFRVVVCDNDSTDGSLERIVAWADGELGVGDDDLSEELVSLVFPVVRKPVSYVEYDRVEAEAGGDESDKGSRLVLIRNGSNGGFAVGNNVGIRYALKRKADYVWLLNNDTLVKANTLKELVYREESEDNIGVSGAVIYFASDPSCVQTYGGGTLSRITGRDRFIHSPGSVDYVAGTSLIVRREVLELVGLLDEGFFFYWEDVDFCRRVLDAGWDLAVAANAVVYHKVSSSVGSQSLRSDLFKVGSLIRYFRKHWGFGCVFPIGINIMGMVVNRLLRRQFGRVGPIIREAFRAMRRK